jgi:predicted  nucleic acid-binding Zn-ribbon protein
MDLARKATNDRTRAQFEDLAHQWQQIASDIEKFRQQIDELELTPALLVKFRRSGSDGGEANA